MHVYHELPERETAIPISVELKQLHLTDLVDLDASHHLIVDPIRHMGSPLTAV